MIKAVLSGSFDFNGVPAMELAKLHSRGVDRDYMLKRAAILTQEIADLRPEKGKAYIHLIALGDQETYGLNRNGDGFPKSANIKYHDTFVKHAHVYKHHQNKDPKKASGMVVASAYNPDARRVELIIGVDEDKWAPELEKLANGELAPVSMACRVPWDECTYCHNRARSRAEYCTDLRNNITKVASNGVHIGAINLEPTFFDISSVMRNADRIAFGLRKVASDGMVSGAELAEELGLSAPAILFEKISNSRSSRKMAALKKLASIEKRIDGALVPGKGDPGGIKKLLPAVINDSPLTEKEALVLHRADPRVVFGHLAKQSACLPIEGFYRVVFGTEYGAVAGEVKQASKLLPGIFSKLAIDPETAVQDGSYEPKEAAVSPTVHDVLTRVVNNHSVKYAAATERLTKMAMSAAPGQLVEKAPTGASAKADFLAREYAKYKLAFVTSAGVDKNDGNLILTALQNYVK